MLGTWFLAARRDDGPRHGHVVAVFDLAAGHRISEDDLDVIELDLPAELRRSTFEDPAELVDAVTLGPIGAGEILQQAAVGEADAAVGAQFSFSVEQEWAVAGTVTVGDRIDLYATDGADDVRRVLTNVVVRAVSRPGDGGLTDGGRQTITVGGVDADDLGRVVGTTRTATLTVVRVTDARPPNSPTHVSDTPSRAGRAANDTDPGEEGEDP